MRLLLVNPNTTQHVTDRMLAQARRAAGARAEVIGVTAAFGPAIIGSRTENAIAGHAAIELAAMHHYGFDAVILGVSMDTALRPLREMLDIPVVGMTEAALLTGCMLGGRIGCLTLGPRLLSVYEELTSSYGLSSRIAGWRALDLPAAYGCDMDDEVTQRIGEACRRMVTDDSADVVLLCGAVLAGYAARIAPTVDVPVVDCIEAATQQAMTLVDLRPEAHRAGSYAKPKGRRVTRVDPSVAHWLEG